MDYTQPFSNTALEKSPTKLELPVSQQNVGQEKNREGMQETIPRDRGTATKQPMEASDNNHIHHSIHPSAENVQLERGARRRQQPADEKAAVGTRVSSSSSSTRAGGEGSNGDGDSGGGGDKKHRRTGNPVTATQERRYQQHHLGTEGSGTEPHHPQIVDMARGGWEGSPTPLSSSPKSDSFSSEHPSVWDVGQPVTGLADVDSASAMNGLLDREVRSGMPSTPS